MSTLYYFAYGSNLHPVRLNERAPSARALGVVTAKACKLTFCKKSEDGSSKCSLSKTGHDHDVVYGVLYEMESHDKNALDLAEGRGAGYNEELMLFELDGVRYTPFTYIADNQYIDFRWLPYEWYRDLVVEGAKYHSMPPDYIAWLEATPATPDPDVKRHTENQQRLKLIRQANNSKPII